VNSLWASLPSDLAQVEIVPVGVKKLPSIGRPSTVMAGYASQLARESRQAGARSKTDPRRHSTFLTLCFVSPAMMRKRMASGTQSDQVFFEIISALTAKLLVMNLQIRFASAALTSPAITAPHLLPQSFVQLRIKPQARLFGYYPVHEACSVTSCRNACR
jgi:hypothetical protein